MNLNTHGKLVTHYILLIFHILYISTYSKIEKVIHPLLLLVFTKGPWSDIEIWNINNIITTSISNDYVCELKVSKTASFHTF